MLQCWQEDPTRRPSFSALSEALEALLEPEVTQVSRLVYLSIFCSVNLDLCPKRFECPYSYSCNVGEVSCVALHAYTIDTRLCSYNPTELWEYESVLPAAE